MPGQDYIANHLSTNELRGHFSTTDRIREYAEYMDYPYFGKVEMRGFRSRLLDGVYHARGRTLFVTSERVAHTRQPDGPRRYSIRRIKVMMSTGELGIDIGSEGMYPWPEYKTARQARAAILRLIAEEEATPPTPEEAALLAKAEALAEEKETVRKRREAAYSARTEEARRRAAAAMEAITAGR